MPIDAGLANPRTWAGVALVGCTALIWARLSDIPLLPVPSKMLASTAFVVVAVLAGATRWRFGRIVLLGLALSWVGDAFLLGSGQRYFLAGLASFLLAHLAYTTAFIVHGVRVSWVVAAALPVTVVSLAASNWLDPHVPAEMAIPVRAYTIVISFMLIAAIGLRGRGGPLLIPLGAGLFYLSDLAVAADAFVDTGVPNFVWGLPLYYGGQLLIAWSAGRSASYPVAADPDVDFRR